MVDWDRVRELRDEIGAEDYAEVVALFFEEVDAVIARLRQPATMIGRESDLHFLRGSAFNLGFVRFGSLCRLAEVRAADGDLTEEELAEIFEVYASSREHFGQGTPRAA